MEVLKKFIHQEFRQNKKILYNFDMSLNQDRARTFRNEKNLQSINAAIIDYLSFSGLYFEAGDKYSLVCFCCSSKQEAGSQRELFTKMFVQQIIEKHERAECKYLKPFLEEEIYQEKKAAATRVFKKKKNKKKPVRNKIDEAMSSEFS